MISYSLGTCPGTKLTAFSSSMCFRHLAMRLTAVAHGIAYTRCEVATPGFCASVRAALPRLGAGRLHANPSYRLP